MGTPVHTDPSSDQEKEAKERKENIWREQAVLWHPETQILLAGSRKGASCNDLQ